MIQCRRLRRDERHLNARQSRVGLDPPAHFQPVQPGHDDVHQDQIGLNFPDLPQAFNAAISLNLAEHGDQFLFQRGGPICASFIRHMVR